MFVTPILRIRHKTLYQSSKEYIEKFLGKVYDAETKQVWGRSADRWALLVVYYTAFYTCLAAFWAALFALWWFYIVDKRNPRHAGPDEGLNWTPGMGFWPILDPEEYSPMIHYNVHNESQIAEIRDTIYHKYLKDYEKKNWVSENGNFIDCTQGRTDPDPMKVCEFKIDWLEPCRFEEEYGLERNTPCIFLKLNKVYGWVPENYDNITEVPDEIKDIWERDVIAVKCFGDDPVSQEYLNDNMLYYPRPGWSFDHYPYLNQQGYKPPLVAVMFTNVPNKVLLFIVCKAYTKNMVYESSYGLGMARFEILSD